jgi:hypothetical protein
VVRAADFTCGFHALPQSKHLLAELEGVERLADDTDRAQSKEMGNLCRQYFGG